MQVVVVQRALVTELLKSSNFSRLLSAVQECRALLEHSRGEEAAVSLEVGRPMGITSSMRRRGPWGTWGDGAWAQGEMGTEGVG